MALECVRTAPEGSKVTVGPPTRSLDQNAALHAKIGEIADRMEWAGRKWDLEVWKRLLVAAWCRTNKEPIVMLPALDGQGVDIVFRRTSDLSRAECSELLEFVNAWAADQPEMAE